MPRQSRLDSPGVLHHVMIIGIEKRKIFRADFDRKNFTNRLIELIPGTKTDCFAWAENMDITSEEVTACDKSPLTVQARSLLCF